MVVSRAFPAPLAVQGAAIGHPFAKNGVRGVSTARTLGGARLRGRSGAVDQSSRVAFLNASMIFCVQGGPQSRNRRVAQGSPPWLPLHSGPGAHPSPARPRAGHGFLDRRVCNTRRIAAPAQNSTAPVGPPGTGSPPFPQIDPDRIRTRFGPTRTEPARRAAAIPRAALARSRVPPRSSSRRPRTRARSRGVAESRSHGVAEPRELCSPGRVPEGGVPEGRASAAQGARSRGAAGARVRGRRGVLADARVRGRGVPAGGRAAFPRVRVPGGIDADRHLRPSCWRSGRSILEVGRGRRRRAERRQSELGRRGDDRRPRTRGTA
jgi:hypothetical protein